MASGQVCTFPGDAGNTGGYYSFQGKVNNSTKSIYSNLYLTVPTVSTGIAELTASVGPVFWLAGTINQACNRESPLCTVINDNEYCLVVKPNSKGLAAVQSYEVINDVFITTSAFYVEKASVPLSLWIKNAGGYYACTDGFGTVSVYFRLNSTTTPLGCDDILINIVPYVP